MKNIPTIALSVLLLGSAGVAGASPLDFLFGGSRRPEPPRHEQHNDHRDNRHDDRYDRDRGKRPTRVEYRAQMRLRNLGYYRGPVDGDFGRGSRAALSRFQRDRGLRPTGWLDERTIRALKL